MPIVGDEPGWVDDRRAELSRSGCRSCSSIATSSSWWGRPGSAGLPRGRPLAPAREAVGPDRAGPRPGDADAGGRPASRPTSPCLCAGGYASGWPRRRMGPGQIDGADRPSRRIVAVAIGSWSSRPRWVVVSLSGRSGHAQATLLAGLGRPSGWLFLWRDLGQATSSRLEAGRDAGRAGRGDGFGRWPWARPNCCRCSNSRAEQPMAGEGPHDIYPFSLEPYRMVECLWPNVFGTTFIGNRSGWL